MGLAQVHIDAVASAAPFADQGRRARNRHCDPHPGDVGDTPAVALWWIGGLARFTADAAFGLGDTLQRHRLALPAIEAKDAVGLGDRHPALDVADLAAALLALLDVGAIKRCRQGSDLFARKTSTRLHG